MTSITIAIWEIGMANPEAIDAGSTVTTPKPNSSPRLTPRGCAEGGDDCRLVAHHASELAAAHADGSQQAELTGALEH